MRTRCMQQFGFVVAAVLSSSLVLAQPAGKGEWINYPEAAKANINAKLRPAVPIVTDDDLAKFIAGTHQCKWVALKCAGGNRRSSEFRPGLVAELKAEGLKVYGWHRVTAGSPALEQGVLARQLMRESDADGLIIVPSGNERNTGIFYERGVNGARDYWRGMTNGENDLDWEVGYSGESCVKAYAGAAEPIHNFFRREVDFWVPRFFWGKRLKRFDFQTNEIEKHWLGFPTHVSVLGQCQATASDPQMIPRFWQEMQRKHSRHSRLTSYSLFMLDEFSEEDFLNWRAIPSTF